MKNQNIGSNNKVSGAGRVNTANPNLALSSNENPSPTVLRELRIALGKVLGVAETPQAGPPDQPNGQSLNLSGNGRQVAEQLATTSPPIVTRLEQTDPVQRPKTPAISEGLLDST